MKGLGWTVIALGVVVAAPLDAQDMEGSWLARWSEDGEPRVRVILDGESWGSWGMSLPEADAEAIWAHAARQEGRVDWTLEAPAGRIVFTGEIGDERGMGELAFYGAPGFAEEMREVGVRVDDDDERLFSAALFRISPRTVRELEDLGFSRPDFDELISSAIFEVDRDFVVPMRERGMDGDLDDFVAFRIHGVTPAFIDDLDRWGLGALDPDELLAFRIHGVTASFVAEMRAAFDRSLAPDDLVAARIHGVTPGFVEAVAGWEMGSPDFDDLLSLRIHGVSEAFVEAMAEEGARPESLEQAVRFRIHGVSPEMVRELREEGWDDLSGEELVRIRIHGMDRLLRRRRGGG